MQVPTDRPDAALVLPAGAAAVALVWWRKGDACAAARCRAARAVHEDAVTVHAVPRIALIHALAHSVAPINDALAREWPDAQRMNLLDDSLSADLARSGRLDDAMTARFLALADYAVGDRRQRDPVHLLGVRPLHRCGQAAPRPLPVLKPNEAMIDEAAAHVRT